MGILINLKAENVSLSHMKEYSTFEKRKKNRILFFLLLLWWELKSYFFLSLLKIKSEIIQEIQISAWNFN